MSSADFMRRAINIARNDFGQKGYRPFGSLIVKNGVIVCEAVSQSRTSNDPTAHAEMLVVRAACEKLGTRDLSGCDLYTTCEPCPLCVSAIWYARVSKAIFAFSTKDCETIGISSQALLEELALPIEDRRHPAERMLVDEANALFAEWVASPQFEP